MESGAAFRPDYSKDLRAPYVSAFYGTDRRMTERSESSMQKAKLDKV